MKDIRMTDAVTLVSMLSRFNIDLELYCDTGPHSGRTKVRFHDVYLTQEEVSILKKFLAGKLESVNRGVENKDD